MDDLKLILVDPDPVLSATLDKHFDGLPNVQVINGGFEGLPEFDCMVSAANSFGLMDGGVDLAIAAFFGNLLVKRVQARILEEHLGEQPVGTSMIVETGHPKHPFIAHTPTMRVPMSISRTDYVYVAMWAMQLAVRNHNRTDGRLIRIVACPGLGTLTDRVAYHEASRQMALAYRHFLAPPKRITWDYASDRQAAIRWGGDYNSNFNRE